MRALGGTGPFAVLALVFGAAALGMACSASDLVLIPDDSPDATSVADGAVPDVPVNRADTSTPAVDASLRPPVDAAPDAPPEPDGGTDAALDAPMIDAGDAGGGVVVGPDGVLRGTVSGPIVHEWHGVLKAGNAACPPGSVVVGAMPAATPPVAGCCEWNGAYVTTMVTNIPVVFDPATRAGTLAGSPIGPFGNGPTSPTGVVSWQINPSATHMVKGWNATEAMGIGVETAANVAASQQFFALDLIKEVIIGVSTVSISWDAANRKLSLREGHQLVPKIAGGLNCNSATGRTGWTLASP